MFVNKYPFLFIDYIEKIEPGKDVKAVKGTVSDEAQVKAETMNPEDLAALDLKAAQIDEATTVKAPDKRTVQDDELVQSAYDKEKADDVI